MDLAIKFNEIGCEFYQQGSMEASFDMFCGAMQALHYSTQSPVAIDAPSSNLLLFTDPSVQRAIDHIGSGEGLGAAASNSNTNYRRREEDAFVCAGVISVEQLIADCSTSPLHWTGSTMFSLTQAAIYFNQALLLQIGVAQPSKRAVYRSLTLYSMAMKQLFDHCPPTSLQTRSSTINLTCAVLNNTGYLLFETAEFECSRLCFQRMNLFLNQLGPPLSDEDRYRREEFGLNILLFWKPLTGAGAA